MVLWMYPCAIGGFAWGCMLPRLMHLECDGVRMDQDGRDTVEEFGIKSGT